MDEYINRDAARPDAFCIGVSCQECPFLKSPLYGGCRIDDFIASLPAADVRPVVRGKWMHKEITSDFHVIGQCSVCKERRRIDNYCPNCGADMDKDSFDDNPPMEYFESGGK